MGISGPWGFQGHRDFRVTLLELSGSSQAHPSQDSEPSPAATLGLIFPISREVLELLFLSTSSGFYHPSPSSKLCSSPLSSSLLFPGWLWQPLELCALSVPIPGSCPGSGVTLTQAGALPTIPKPEIINDTEPMREQGWQGLAVLIPCTGALHSSWLRRESSRLKITLRNKSSMQRWPTDVAPCKSKI